MRAATRRPRTAFGQDGASRTVALLLSLHADAGKEVGSSQRCGHTRAISGIATHAVVDMALFDELGRIAQRSRGIVEQVLLLRWGHLPEQLARLGQIVVAIRSGGGAPRACRSPRSPGKRQVGSAAISSRR